MGYAAHLASSQDLGSAVASPTWDEISSTTGNSLGVRQWPFAGEMQPANRNIGAQLAKARRALEEIAEARRRNAQAAAHALEVRWLAENQHRYVGRWIALDGDQLLASGENAHDVFAAVRDRNEPALVIQIQEPGLPFAGW